MFRTLQSTFKSSISERQSKCSFSLIQSFMRLTILAFGFGIAFLQVQGELPTSGMLYGLVALSLIGVFVMARRKHWLLRFMLLVACFALGFGWAGWMAQHRLADQLPEA